MLGGNTSTNKHGAGLLLEKTGQSDVGGGTLLKEDSSTSGNAMLATIDLDMGLGIISVIGQQSTTGESEWVGKDLPVRR